MLLKPSEKDNMHQLGRPRWGDIKSSAKWKANKHMNNKQVILAGVNSLNESRVAEVVSKARGIISEIGLLLNQQADLAKQNAEATDRLKKLESTDITYDRIVGKAAPTAPNLNQTTILKAFVELNEKEQAQVKALSTSIITDLKARENRSKVIGEQIAKLREELAKLEVSEVKADEIVG